MTVRLKWRLKNGHEKGEFGESVWANIFAACGFVYVPLKDLPSRNGKGPRMFGNDTILPDFDVTGPRRAYVDSKLKLQPVRFQLANELRHGIDAKDLEAYSAVGGINRQRVLIGVVEVFDEGGIAWSGSLLLQSLAELGTPSRGFSHQRHMVYWARDKFSLIGTLTEAEMWELYKRGDIDGTFLSNAKSKITKVMQLPETIQRRMF